eukprot:7740178-Pyramimonas_sp.AAC.1
MRLSCSSRAASVNTVARSDTPRADGLAVLSRVQTGMSLWGVECTLAVIGTGGLVKRSTITHTATLGC